MYQKLGGNTNPQLSEREAVAVCGDFIRKLHDLGRDYSILYFVGPLTGGQGNGCPLAWWVLAGRPPRWRCSGPALGPPRREAGATGSPRAGQRLYGRHSHIDRGESGSSFHCPESPRPKAPWDIKFVYFTSWILDTKKTLIL